MYVRKQEKEGGRESESVYVKLGKVDGLMMDSIFDKFPLLSVSV